MDLFHIYGYKISTGESFPICIGRKSNPTAIKEGIAFWTEYYVDDEGIPYDSDIFAYDILTSTEFPV